MSKEGDNCSIFIVGDDWDSYDHVYQTLCRCPKCGGFLPRNFPVGGTQFKCNKCGSILETIPDIQTASEDGFLEDMEADIEEGEWTQDDIDEAIYESYGGKICLVPEYAVKKQ